VVFFWVVLNVSSMQMQKDTRKIKKTRKSKKERRKDGGAIACQVLTEKSPRVWIL
jgi:hypothetical protein